MPYQARPARRGQFGGTRHRSNTQSFSPRRGSSKRRNTKENIHPSRFVKAAKPVEVEEYVPTHMFDDFNMHPLLKKNIADRGFTTPSPIQDQTVPVGLEGKDIIGMANTGTGKTLAFLIPIINKLIEKKGDRALIVAPTRELAQQIEQEARLVGRGSGVFGTLLIGGSPMGPQLRDLSKNVDVVIGTPGRIKDHIERGTLDLAEFTMVVLDEVDRMLDMGFINDVRQILGMVQPERQSFFFSATLDRRVQDLIATFVRPDAVTVSVKTGDTSDSVHQDIVPFESSSDKIAQLHNLLISDALEKVIIFDETQRSVERLARELHDRGFKVDDIHGGKTQGARKRALDKFKRGDITILVATDVAARGIDVKDISHVINYATPQSYEDYVHRIGRAGRAGRTGYALTFIQG